LWRREGFKREWAEGPRIFWNGGVWIRENSRFIF